MPIVGQKMNDDDWKRGMVEMTYPDKPNEAVMGRVWSRFGITLDTGKNEGLYKLTHTLTGCHIISTMTELDAKKIAKYLHEQDPTSWELRTQVELEESVPQWLQKWLKDCRKIKRFIVK